MNVRIARFRQSRDFVKQSDDFIEDKASGTSKAGCVD